MTEISSQNEENFMTNEYLVDALKEAKKDILTDDYTMSIGELMSLYRDGDIILNSTYQRLIIWDQKQKSRLIESILIGLPLPSLFVGQQEDGKWEVIDGLQRLSTIFDFVGILKEDMKTGENYNKFDKLSNEADDLFYLGRFSGKSWDDLPTSIQIDLKRTRVHVFILLRSQDEAAKFELFQRLNSGGTNITGQEMRNAILADICPNMLEWIAELSKEKSFKEVVGLSDKKKDERYDMELVLRFLALQSDYLDEIRAAKSFDTYLTTKMREFAKEWNQDKFDKKRMKHIFVSTFDLIRKASGKGALKAKTGFSVALFEAVAVGVARNIENPLDIETISQKIKNIQAEEKFKESVSGGRNMRSRIPALLEFGESYFKKES